MMMGLMFSLHALRCQIEQLDPGFPQNVFILKYCFKNSDDDLMRVCDKEKDWLKVSDHESVQKCILPKYTAEYLSDTQ